MTKNPLINASSATVYIVIVSSAMFYGTKSMGTEDTVMAPIVVLSLFTLSAAVMGYLFLYQPFQMYLDGKKKEALNLFLQTLASFGVITAVILALFFSRVLG